MVIGYIVTGAIFFWFGFLANIVYQAIKSPTKAGTLLVTEDQDGTYLMLKVRDMNDIKNSKEVCLNVTHSRY